MVFGETPAANAHNAEVRIFKLGNNRVRERLSYDHVGVTTCLFDDDVSGVEGRLAKARRALNSISGLGIRRNGLSVVTCCVIFWSIVAPIALFGCEMWILNDRTVRLLDDFQIYAGKRVQRLYSKSPNICSFFGLGWIRLERLIEVKKLLFVRSLLSLEEHEPSRIIFCARMEVFMRNIDDCSMNVCSSMVFDLMNAAVSFGVLDEVVNMARGIHIWSKIMWKRKIWARAWELDIYLWRVQTRCHRSLGLLSSICSGPGFLIWWQIAQDDHRLIIACEKIVKLVSHSSALKADDVRLKGAPAFAKFCSDCDHAATDDARHLVLQCPKWQPIRNEMFDAIASIPDGCGRAILDSQCDLALVLMGKSVDGIMHEQMIKIWTISAVYISRMYDSKLKEGIG